MNEVSIEMQRIMITLIRSAIDSSPIDLPKSIDWYEILEIAESQGIKPMIIYGAYKSGIELPDDIYKQLKYDLYQSIVIDECQREELSKLFNELESKKIKYMPLKGIRLKLLYPNSEMRFMGDADILISTAQINEINDIMRRFGYTKVLESDHEIKWIRHPYMVIELHKRLIPSYNTDYYAYYSDGWQFAHQSEKGEYFYEMKAEDELIFMLTHFAKHYRDGGIGISHLVDFRVFLNNNSDLNQAYIQNELEKLELYQFYKNILGTLQVWFSNSRSSEMSNHITRHIFLNGIYGTHNNEILASAVKGIKHGEPISQYCRRRLIKCIFMPYVLMKQKYPILDKVPPLLPFFWLFRIVTITFLHHDKMKNMLDDLIYIANASTDEYLQDLNYVGLKLK